MTKDYKIAKERINECIKNKSGRLNLFGLKINKLPKLIKKCKNHLLKLYITCTKIKYISTSLYKLQLIFLHHAPIIHYPIISLDTCYSSSHNYINHVEYDLYNKTLFKYFGNLPDRHFIQIIITIKYIQRLYRKYLFYLNFYSVY